MVQRGTAEQPYPRFIEPMECLAVPKLPGSARWVYEVKLDGYRVIATKDGKDVGLFSRYGNALTRQFSAIAFALQQVRTQALVLDGEIVALDENGRPDFQQLQNRKRSGAPIVFYVFDVLHIDRQDLLHLPLSARRKKLAALGKYFREPLRLAPVLDAELDSIIAGVKQSGFEGVVAKRADSIYESGKRSGAWQKKRFSAQQTFTIGGYIPGPNSFDALLIGEWRDDKLYYLKKLRTGFVPETRRQVLKAIEPYRTNKCPFVNLPETRRTGHRLDAEAMKDCHWVKPQVECEVDFVERTASGKLRHAQFRLLIGTDVSVNAKVSVLFSHQLDLSS